MQISSYSSVNSTANTNTGTSTQSQTGTSSAMDPSKFMSLLLAQLSNQNPMEPMKDNEMMSQMAQLNSLQELQLIKTQIQDMAADNRLSYASSLVGKNVKADVNGKAIEGQVSAIIIDGTSINAQIGTQTIPLESIKEVSIEAKNG